MGYRQELIEKIVTQIDGRGWVCYEQMADEILDIFEVMGLLNEETINMMRLDDLITTRILDIEEK